MRRSKLVLVSVLVQGILAVLVARPASATTEKTCYNAVDDYDGDGYAHSGASSVNVSVGSSSLNCPSGYVLKAGDCNDGNAAVHPRRAEAGFNGVDDDCEGGADQSEPSYTATGNANTTSGFKMTVYVNDSAIWALGSGATGEVELERLGAGSSVRLPRQNAPMQSFWGIRFVQVSVGGLAETTVYRARIRFFNARVQVGRESIWYYTTTDGTTEKSKARTAIVLKGLKELDESDRGRVGWRGTSNVDGTRYGASTNEKWCSEFYSWTAKDELSGIAGRSSVDSLVSYFASHGAYYTGSGIATWGRRGDYVAMDTNDDGKKNHSGMFLALQGSTAWTLEGNTGNTVGVRQRTIGSEVVGLGHIEYSML